MNSIKPFLYSLGTRASDYPKNALSQISWRGRQIYTTCASTLVSSRKACCQAAEKTFQNATWSGVKLGYSVGPEVTHFSL